MLWMTKEMESFSDNNGLQKIGLLSSDKKKKKHTKKKKKQMNCFFSIYWWGEHMG